MRNDNPLAPPQSDRSTTLSSELRELTRSLRLTTEDTSEVGDSCNSGNASSKRRTGSGRFVSFVFIKHSTTKHILGGGDGCDDQARLTQIFELLMSEITAKCTKTELEHLPSVSSETIVTLISQDLIMRPTSTTSYTS